MTPHADQLLSQAEIAGNDYIQVLTDMTEATGRLMASVQKPDNDGMMDLVKLREQLTRDISVKAAEFNHLMTRLTDMPDASKHHASAIRPLIDQVQRLQGIVMHQHADCEALVRKRLDEYKQQLLEFRQRRGLRSTYGYAPARRSARFLDSRL